MNEKFFNRFRILSTRMQNWDYGWNAPYFVTICTQKHTCYFGKIVEGKIELSEIGKIAQQYWTEIPAHFPYVHLGAFVIMPNHIHGIVIIDKPNVRTPESQNVRTPDSQNARTPDLQNVRTPDLQNLETPDSGVSTIKQTKAASKKWKPETLGVIINQYKRKITIDIRRINPHFAWQTRFYDHIIRNHESYVRIEQYIINNPLKWVDDQFFER